MKIALCLYNLKLDQSLQDVEELFRVKDLYCGIVDSDSLEDTLLSIEACTQLCRGSRKYYNRVVFLDMKRYCSNTVKLTDNFFSKDIKVFPTDFVSDGNGLSLTEEGLYMLNTECFCAGYVALQYLANIEGHYRFNVGYGSDYVSLDTILPVFISSNALSLSAIPFFEK